MSARDQFLNLAGAWALQVSGVVARAMADAIEQEGSVASALVVIADQPEITVGDLALAVGLSQPATTHAVSRLIALGWVQTSVVGQDRRRRSLALTSAGRRAARRALAARHAALDRLLGSADGSTRRQMEEGFSAFLHEWAAEGAGLAYLCRTCARDDCKRCPVAAGSAACSAAGSVNPV